MTQINERKINTIVYELICQFNAFHTSMLLDDQLKLAQTIEALERAKAAEYTKNKD